MKILCEGIMPVFGKDHVAHVRVPYYMTHLAIMYYYKDITIVLNLQEQFENLFCHIPFIHMLLKYRLVT